ncbi:MAG: hypothetical protein JW764_08670 [Chlorobiaceae bacterium]|nr:hypothetical protein [Chlorobiaceae bacterium]
MNRNSEHLEAEVSKTLELLDQMPKVQVSGRFRTQLLHRIDSMEHAGGAVGTTVLAVFSPKLAFLTLLLMLNIASAMLLFMNGGPQSATGISGTLAETFSDDYGGPALSYYDDQSALGR